MAKQVDPAAVQKEFDSFFQKKSADVAAAIDALLEEETEIQTKADERKKMIREQIKPLNELYARATGKPYLTEAPKGKGNTRTSSAKPGELTGAALAAKGEEAIAFLKKKADWTSGKEIAEHIGYHAPAAAIAAAEGGEAVDKRGPGRAREFKYKG